MALFEVKHDYYVIYVYAIDDEAHKDALKIGRATITLTHKELQSLCANPTDEPVWMAANQRIKQQVSQSAVKAHCLYAELGYYIDEDGTEYQFDDNRVHVVLEQNGFNRKVFPNLEWNPKDWYICSLDDVKLAIRTIKSGHSKMPQQQVGTPIKFREEQERAINQTLAHFQISNKMLWNAKMRFGKTLCSLELIRRKGFHKTLIVTHRPAVRDSWFTDYQLLDFTGYNYGCKLAEAGNQPNVGEPFATLERDYKHHQTKYIYFASMQDLRGGDDIKKGGINKNHEIFRNKWDLIIVDEAHEGTQTSLGKNVLEALAKKKPYFLYLSGTPYNILNQFSDEEIFTWDYNMEQAAKERFAQEHPGENNDYEELPRLNIRTYRLRDNFETYYDYEDDYFNFAELFRTWTGDADKDGSIMPTSASVGSFVHEGDVRAFLDLMHKEGTEYPFSTNDYCELFAHTFWVLPGVKAAKALSALLQEKDSWWQDPAHRFEIVNVAGEGDDPAYDRDETEKQVKERERKEKDALQKVKKAIKKHSRTITLSCGRLTTGVTVKPWTGVFMLKGNGDTKAAFYMQTIFRAQSPNKSPYLKTNCYAFDFAPDRTLTVVDEYLSSQPNNRDHRKRPKETVIDEFLRFCSVVSIDGSQMTEFDTRSFITQVNRAYKDFIVRHGFKGRQLYVDLYQLTKEDQLLLEEIAGVLSTGKATDGSGKVEVNKRGTKVVGGKKKKINDIRSARTSKERQNLRDRYQKILDTISIRLPMMVFGEVESMENFSMEKFIKDIRQESWNVFMPKDITKQHFLKLVHLYNTDALLAAFDDILKQTHHADLLPIAERAIKMVDILSTFHFPDKETVLTPWRVVNIHMAETIGGYDFYDETHSQQLAEPRFAPKEDITDEIFADSTSHVLEINAKSGVYPLWLAYTFFRYREKAFERLHGTPPNETEQIDIWQAILRDNIFVLCMSPMAVKITERALRGYRNYQTNCKYQPKLLGLLKNEEEQKKLVKRLQKYSYWGIENMEPNKFEFKAVVGNPPYQVVNKGDGTGADPIYNYFIDLSKGVSSQGSLIHPGRFLFNAGKTPKEWNAKMLSDSHFKVIKYYSNSGEVFPTVDIKGGIAITYWNAYKSFIPIGFFTVYPVLKSIVEKVKLNNFSPLSQIVYPRDLYHLTDVLYSENTWAEGRQSDGHKYDVGSGVFDVIPELFFEERPNDGKDYSLIYGRKNNERVLKWIRTDYLKSPDNLHSYKVFVAKTNGSGTLGESLSMPIIGEPNVGHTVTFLSIGKFATEIEAQALLKYIQTKFARTLLGTLKVTQDNPKETWSNIPLQDFTTNSDIDWSKSVAEIDKQLYAKYNLSDKEIAFIEKMINSMY